MGARCTRRSKLVWCLLILALLVMPSFAAKNTGGKKNNGNKNKGNKDKNKNGNKDKDKNKNDNKNKDKNGNKDKNNNGNKDKDKNGNKDKDKNGNKNTPAASDGAPGPVAPPPPLTTEQKLKIALSCMEDKKLALITDKKKLKSTITLWNKLNTTMPLAAVQPSSTQEVSDALSCMYTNGIRSVPLGGGHSYEGMSVLPSTVTIDLSKMKNVALNVDSTVVVQGGALLGDIYYTVWKNSAGKFAVVGSSCPSLGTGHILGGGLSSLSRMFGLACDQLLSLTMVDYKGDIIQVTPDSNPDLFWSACGGGGGNFGVVTEYKIKSVNVPAEITSFDFSVQKNRRDFLEHVQNDVATKANSLISGLRLSLEKDSIDVEGLYLGPKSSLDDALKEADLKAYADTNIGADQQSWIEYIMKDAKSVNCSSPKNPQDLLDNPKNNSIYASMNSFYVLPSKPLEQDAYQTLLDWKEKNKDAIVEINVLGPTSAIASRDAFDTAYPYRSALLAVQYGSRWNNTEDSQDNIALTADLTNKVNPYLSNPDPPRVVNFLDIQSPSLTGYYGVNLPRLADIKLRYDPQNYFQNPLTIPPLQLKQDDVASPGVQRVETDNATDVQATMGPIASSAHMPAMTLAVAFILLGL